MDYSLGRRSGITTATAPLQEVRALRREREDRDKANARQAQERTLQGDIAKQQLAAKSQFGLAQLQGQQSAAEGRRQRAFTADQSSRQASREADRLAFDAFAKGVLTPEQASVAGSYRPETGYRFKDIGTPTPLSATGRGGGRSAGLQKAPDMMKIYSDSSARFFGKGREGKVLRDKYGDDFDKYMEDIVAKYGTPQQPVGQQPSALLPVADQSRGTITGRGGVLAASRGGQLVDAEQYAQSLLPSAPAGMQQQVEQPTKRFNVALPQVQGIEDITIPEEFTAADMIPGVSRAIPQRTQRFISGLDQLGKQLSSPIDLKNREKLNRQRLSTRRSFVRSRPY